MDTTASSSNAINVDGHNLSVRIHGGEGVAGVLVRLCVAELGHDHPPLDEVVVDVACCEVFVVLVLPSAFVGPRRRKRGHVEGAALCICRVLENIQVREGDVVVVALGIGVIGGDNDAGTDEASVEVGMSGVRILQDRGLTRR